MKTALLFFALFLALLSSAQTPDEWLGSLPLEKDYVQKRASSYDRSGANADAREIAPGATLTLLDADGPAVVSHIWVTIASPDSDHLKALVLRMYWDNEAAPSVEAPVGDFYGLGLGEYFLYESIPLSVGSKQAMNCYFPMPFQKHAKITVTNEGSEKTDAFYFNIDYRVYSKPQPPQLYFHAQYRQASPAHGWTNKWSNNGQAGVGDRKNLKGEGNYVWMEATDRGHFVGVTMSILQNQDDWWGEGDDMFFVDGEELPSVNGTGSEDYFLGAWGFGVHGFSYGLYGAPVKGADKAGSRTSVYRFHLDSPITFTKSLRATIEHGHANHRSDNFFSVAYWYQTEPHVPFPALPPLADRIPKIFDVGGPGNSK